MNCLIKTNKTILLCCLFSAMIFFLNSASAQQCDNANAATVHAIVNQVATACCVNKSRARAQRTCIKRNKNRKLKRAGRSGLPREFMTLLNGELDAMRTSSCSDTTVDVPCDNTYAATPNEVIQNVEGRCCDLTKNRSRKTCLSTARRRFRAAQRLLGSGLVTNVRSEIRTLSNSQSCGEGGERSSCDSFRGTGGGYLHKPVSESTHSVVNLFPVGERPADCRYEDNSGNVFTSGFYAGIHNGNRVHIRPRNATSCRNFPSPLILNCRHGSQRICRRMPNPCQRYS